MFFQKALGKIQRERGRARGERKIEEGRKVGEKDKGTQSDDKRQ